MWFNRRFLGELLADWRASQRMTVEAIKANTEIETRAADKREAMLVEQLARAIDDRDSAAEAAEVHFEVLAKRLGEVDKALAVSEAERKILSDQLQIAQNNYEWARVRLNQVEQERSILLDRFASVQVPAMQLVRQAAAHGVPAPEEAPPEDAISALAQGIGLPAGMFEDMGDENASKQGYTTADAVDAAQ